MSIQEAVTTVLTKKYADFTGRARRSEYWWFALANFIASTVLGIVDRAIGVHIFQLVLSLAVLIPGLAVAVRRLHDTDRSGWWLLLLLIPIIGWIIVIVWLATDGNPGENQYGPSPKAAQGWTPNAGPDPSWGQS